MRSRILRVRSDVVGVIAVAMLASGGRGGVIHVDGDAAAGGDGSSWVAAYADLQDALNAADPGDEIWVAQGVYRPTATTDRQVSFTVGADIDLFGGFPAGGGDGTFEAREPQLFVTELSGDLGQPGVADDNTRHIVTIGGDAAMVDGVTIADGNANLAPDTGGGVLATGVTASFHGCTFRNNAAGRGGAVAVQTLATLSFDQCRFLDNEATRGAAIHASIGSAITLENCRFERNVADTGGAVFSDTSAITMESCVLVENIAQSQPLDITAGLGGAAYIRRGSVAMVATVIRDSVAGSSGTLYLENTDAAITLCRFEDNRANRGGGIFARTSTVDITQTTFDRNLATLDGGGLALSIQCDATLHRCTLRENVADTEGGGLQLQNAMVAVTACGFFDNEAARGGGLHSENSTTLDLTGSVFAANLGLLGGGAYFQVQGPQTVADCRFDTNSASLGAGLYAFDTADLTVDRNRFTGNTADFGGGLYAQQSGLTLTNAACSSNAASGAGGAMFFVDQGVTVLNCTTHANSAPEGASIGAATDASVTVVNSILWDDAAVGAFAIEAGSTIEATFSIIRGGAPGIGNLDDDPVFWQDADDNQPGNLRLLPDSPAIDAGDDTAVPADLVADLDGQPRIIDGDGDGTAQVDIGAYEFFDRDCNLNRVHDGVEIAAGTLADCNDNGLADSCELMDGVSPDCNANGIPDACEPDCDNNGVPDDCDIAAGTVNDCSGNGVPDVCEPDCNMNGVADDCDIVFGTSLDANLNTIPDDCEPDCNSNGLPDFVELFFGFAQDCNLNARPDDCDIADEVSGDCNLNGIPDECDIADAVSEDCDGNGVPDVCDLAQPGPLLKLFAADAVPRDFMGLNFGFDDQTIIVGSPGDDDFGGTTGSAYIFRRFGARWFQQQKLVASNGQGGAGYGSVCDVFGDRAIVGAYDHDFGLGEAYIYHYDPNARQWVERARLAGVAAFDFGTFFGVGVAMHNDQAAVLGFNFVDQQIVETLYVFREVQNPTVSAPDAASPLAPPWELEAVLPLSTGVFPTIPATNRIIVEPDRIIVGSVTDSGGGAVFIFDRIADTWMLRQQIRGDNTVAGDRFGSGIATDGDWLVVGADRSDEFGSSSGAVYIFRESATSGLFEQEQRLFTSDLDAGDRLGFNVAIEDDVIVLGAHENDRQGPDAGTGYVFHRIDSQWEQVGFVEAADTTNGDGFALCVGLEFGRYAFGAHRDNARGADAGAMYISRPGPDCNDNGVLDACEIADGDLIDSNDNGVADSCEDLPCPNDCAPLGGDGTVNIDDILSVVLNFGSDQPHPCDTSPIGGDGQINIDDLLAVVNAIGRCTP